MRSNGRRRRAHQAANAACASPEAITWYGPDMGMRSLCCTRASASHYDYDESVFFTSLPVGTCQDALDTACGLYLNDPTAWTRPPTNLRARPLSTATALVVCRA